MIRIIDCEQGSPEWHHARLGLPTASEFATILASGRGGGESKTRRAYLLRLAGEILTGEPIETYSNGHMDRGRAMEAEARNLYAFMTDADPQRVGFIVNSGSDGRQAVGCSPDSLIEANGVLEVKTKLPHLVLECLLRDEFPSEHKAQAQGLLWVGERDWVDISVYWPKLPLFIKRTYREESYIRQIADAVARFNDELQETVARVRAHMSGTGSAQLMAKLNATVADLDRRRSWCPRVAT